VPPGNTASAVSVCAMPWITSLIVPSPPLTTTTSTPADAAARAISMPWRS
jgi:hypothetical protein